MATLSGKLGKVLVGAVTVQEVTEWTFNPTSNNPSYATGSPATPANAGYKQRVVGVQDGSGTINGKYDSDNPVQDILWTGLPVTLKLYVDATHFYVVPAVIDSLNAGAEQDEGAIVEWSADFSINGKYTMMASF